MKQQLDGQIFAAWIKPLALEQVGLNQQASDHTSAEVQLVGPNKFSCEHVEHQYGELIATTIAHVVGVENVTLRFRPASRFTPSIRSNQTAGRAQTSSAPSPIGKVIQSTLQPGLTPVKGLKQNQAPAKERRAYRRDPANLNPKYHFNNFVVGACNQLAHAVSLRVAEGSGGSYNPLFIYGGVGLGKTHLANAVGNLARSAGKKVLLVSSEIFVNELISALRSNRMQEFKDRFRSLDLLIIDDVQFITGKERTQEEFFHTFNALYQRHSQIVITSDRVPQELTGLEDRLRTRFSSGISVDVQAPDFETRVAIVMKKAELQGVELRPDAARLLAEKIDSNVRELEGALNRLHAFGSLGGVPITLDLAEEALRNIIPEKTREITIELIQKTVAERYSLTIKDLIGKRRSQHIALPRHVAMYLCRRLTTCSYPEIGALFGGRDHSTAIHANRAIEERISSDTRVRDEVSSLERRLKG